MFITNGAGGAPPRALPGLAPGFPTPDARPRPARPRPGARPDERPLTWSAAAAAPSGPSALPSEATSGRSAFVSIRVRPARGLWDKDALGGGRGRDPTPGAVQPSERSREPGGGGSAGRRDGEAKPAPKGQAQDPPFYRSGPNGRRRLSPPVLPTLRIGDSLTSAADNGDRSPAPTRTHLRGLLGTVVPANKLPVWAKEPTRQAFWATTPGVSLLRGGLIPGLLLPAPQTALQYRCPVG